jgi:4-hydroxybenzoate polyprenyltransferase
MGARRSVGAVAARDYLRLARLQTSGVTACAPVFGYLAASYAAGRPMGEAFADISVMPVLLGVGFAAHVFGFVHNEIADQAVDTKAAYRRAKPLPSGAVSQRGAWALAVAALGAGLALAVWLRGDGSVAVLAGASALLAALYNVRGKEVVGGDAILAASIAVFVLAGAAVVAGLASALAPSALGIAAVAALTVFFNNAFEGGFKDHATDKEGGKRTLVLWFRERGLKYDSPDGLLVFAQVPVHGAMLLAGLYLITGPLATGDFAFDGVRIALALVLVGAMVRFYNRGIAREDRHTMLTFFARHEGAALLLLLLPFLGHLPAAWFLVLFVAPLLVFVAVNRALYGTLAAPDV